MAFSSFARRRAVDFWPTQCRHAQRNAAAETAISTARVFLEAAPSTLVDEGKAARTQKITLLFVGYLSYVLLIANFARRPLHPKFHVNEKTRRRVYVHIWLGSMEVSLGMLLLSLESKKTRVAVGSCTCALLAFAQFATSSSQIKSAFGTPKLVRPTLHLINFMHAERAVRVLVGASRWLAKSGFWSERSVSSVSEAETEFVSMLVDQLVLAQGFAYSRVFVAALSTVYGVRELRYTIGSLMAAQLVVATTYGFFGSFCLILAILLYANINESENLGMERQYWATPTQTKAHTNEIEIKPFTRDTHKRHTARDAFDRMDNLSKNGLLQKDEVEDQLLKWGVENRDIEDFFAVHDSDGDKNLDYDEIMSKDSGRRLLSYIATCLDDEDSWLLSRERRRKHA